MQADVGDFGNLLYVRTIIHKGSQKYLAPHEQPLVFAKPYSPRSSSSSDEASPADVAAHLKSVEECRLSQVACETPGSLVNFGWYPRGNGAMPCKLKCSGPGSWFGLLGAPTDDGTSPSFSTHNILNRLMRIDETDDSDTLIILPGCEQSASDAASDDDGSILPSDPKRPRIDPLVGGGLISGPAAPASETADAPLFHYDAYQNSCFTADEARRTSAHLAAGDFLGHLVRRVNTTAFVLPQSRIENEAHFCNEVRAWGICRDVHVFVEHGTHANRRRRRSTASSTLWKCTGLCASLRTYRSPHRRLCVILLLLLLLRTRRRTTRSLPTRRRLTTTTCSASASVVSRRTSPNLKAQVQGST